jgi:hypothetical protein
MVEIQIGTTVTNGAAVEPVGLRFDDAHVHTGIVGATGSGKTVLLEKIMYELLDTWQADVWFAQFPQTSSSMFSRFSGNARFTLVPYYNLDNRLEVELNERVNILEKHRVDNAKDIDDLPTLVVVIEMGPDTLHNECRALMRAARQGRALDVHLCWAAQNIDYASWLQPLTTNRISLRVVPEQAFLFGTTPLGDVNPAAFTKPGEAVIDDTHFIVTPAPAVVRA